LAKEIVNEALDLMYPASLYCIGCEKIIDETRPYRLCNDCMKAMNWLSDRTCSKCGRELLDNDPGNECFVCREHTHNFRRAYSCATYGDHEKKIIYDLKYNAHPDIAKTIAEVMHDRLEFIRYKERVDASARTAAEEYTSIKYNERPREEESEEYINILSDERPREEESEEYTNILSGEGPRKTGRDKRPVLNKYDLIVPVPLYKGKQAKRGFNQAALIAKELAKNEGSEYVGDLVIRNRNTAVMNELGASERRRNIIGAFEINERSNFLKRIARSKVSESKGVEANGKEFLLSMLPTILVVDDLVTTASTVDEVAKVLYDAGAVIVDVITFASGRDGIYD